MLLKATFSRLRAVSAPDIESTDKEGEVRPWQRGEHISQGTQVLKLESDMDWKNVGHFKRYIFDTCMVHNSGVAVDSLDKPERLWSFGIHKHVAALWSKHSSVLYGDDFVFLILKRPRLRIVVLDMTLVSFIDSSAILNLEVINRQLCELAGSMWSFDSWG
jgi:hypothetical protein